MGDRWLYTILLCSIMDFKRFVYCTILPAVFIKVQNIGNCNDLSFNLYELGIHIKICIGRLCFLSWLLDK